MRVWEIVFRDIDARSGQVRAAGYKLLHNDQVLSFYDDNGVEVFASNLHTVLWWRPTVSTSGCAAAEAPGRLAPPADRPGGVSPSFRGSEPAADSRSPIGDRVANDLRTQVGA